MFKYVLFDLDGTLTDAAPGITNSVKYSLEKFGINETNENKLRKFLGPPLLLSFKEIYGFTDEQAEKAVEYYREYFKPHGIFENEVYDGIPELFKGNGKSVTRIIEHQNLSCVVFIPKDIPTINGFGYIFCVVDNADRSPCIRHAIFAVLTIRLKPRSG